MHPDVPLLITETGLSVSPNVGRAGPPDYGYGGNTEEDQRSGIVQNLSDVRTAAINIAGVSIHEYLDAWWKFSLQDSLSQDPDDIEEWFGMMRLVDENGRYVTRPRPVYNAVQSLWLD